MGFNKRRVLSQSMHIYLQENQHDISVFRMVTTHSAHCYNSPDPPFLFSPPSISLCSQMYFSISKYTFFFLLLYPLPLQVFVCVPSLLIFSAFIIHSPRLTHYVCFSSSSSPVVFPQCSVNETAAFPPFPLFSEHFAVCCSIWRPLSVVHLLLVVKDLCSGPNCIKAASGC